MRSRGGTGLRAAFAIRQLWRAAVIGLVLAGVPVAAWTADHLDHRADFILLTLDGRHVKWGAARFGTSAVIRYAFVTGPLVRKATANCRDMRPFPDRLESGRVSFPDVVTEVRAALASWEQAVALRFEAVADPADADLLFGVQAKPRGIAFADVVAPRSSPAAVAPIRQAAICLNPSIHWETAFDGDPRTHDIRFVVAHEIGHVIGLDHVPSATGGLMSFKYRETIRQPQAGDIAGARLLYGAPLPMAEPPSSGRPIANAGIPGS